MTGRHTETNTRLLVATGPVLALATVAMAAGWGGPVPGALALVAGLLLLLGHTLQVTAQEGSVEVWLGMGILRTRVTRGDIAAVTLAQVDAAPWLGRGVRGAELVYAVGRRPAARLELRDGRVLVIGVHSATDLVAQLSREVGGS